MDSSAQEIPGFASAYRLPPDPDDISWIPVKDFLRSFHASILCYIPDAESEKSLPVTHSDVLDVGKQLEGYGVFYSVNGFKNARSRAQDNLLCLNAAFVDIDYPKQLHGAPSVEALARFKADKLEELATLDMEGYGPSYTTETKNGFHVLWVFDEPLVLDNFVPEARNSVRAMYARLETALITRLGGDPGASDVTRVLRLPNTWHFKDPKNPFLAKLKHSSGATFDFEKLLNYFSSEEGATGARAFMDPSALQGLIWRDASGSLPPIPEAAWPLLDTKFPPMERDSFQEVMKKDGHEETGRNNRLVVAVSGMRRSGKSKEECLDYFDHYNGLPESEIASVIKSVFARPEAYSYGWNSLVLAPYVTNEERDRAKTYLSIICADLRANTAKGESELFEDLDKKIAKRMFNSFERILCSLYPFMRYCTDGFFYFYESGVYVRRDTEQIKLLIAREMEKKKLMDFRSVSNINSKLLCLRSIPEITLEQDDMNADPDIVNLRNGLFNLRTGELTPHSPNYFSTIQLDASYRPGRMETLAPRWLRFMDEIMDGNEGKVRFLQQMAGYCMTRSTRFQTAFVLIGAGANGKSTFTRALCDLLGNEKNVSHLSLDALQKDFGMVGIYGKTLNIIEEINDSYFDARPIKLIISGDRTTVARKYMPHLDMEPFAKLVFSVNELPKSNENSYGYYRRFKIVRFERTFLPDGEHGLRAALEAERDGILAWCIAGWRDCLENGLVTPPDVAREGERFKESNSSLIEFLLHKCQVQAVGEPAPMPIDFDLFYNEYDHYISGAHYQHKSKGTVFRELKGMTHSELKLVKVIDSRGNRQVLGIKKLGDGFAQTFTRTKT